MATTTPNFNLPLIDGTMTVSIVDDQNALAQATDAALLQVQNSEGNSAPKMHASAQPTYGLGTATDYGHVRLSDTPSASVGVNQGTAATPAAVATVSSTATQAAADAAQAKSDAAEAKANVDAAKSAADAAQSTATAAQTTATAAQTKADSAYSLASSVNTEVGDLNTEVERHTNMLNRKPYLYPQPSKSYGGGTINSNYVYNQLANLVTVKVNVVRVSFTGDTPVTAFTLPAGVRPTVQIEQIMGAKNNNFIIARVQPSGVVDIYPVGDDNYENTCVLAFFVNTQSTSRSLMAAEDDIPMPITEVDENGYRILTPEEEQWNRELLESDAIIRARQGA